MSAFDGRALFLLLLVIGCGSWLVHELRAEHRTSRFVRSVRESDERMTVLPSYWSKD